MKNIIWQMPSGKLAYTALPNDADSTACAAAALAFCVIGTPVCYIGYGFSMAADRADKDGLSPRHVYLVDLTIATVFVFLDGLLNAVVYPLICLDFRPRYAFRRVKVKGYSFWFFELVTERLSRYNEDPAEWWWRRKVAAAFASFLDGKDKKGWHIRKPAHR